jgi:hypothetical protein
LALNGRCGQWRGMLRRWRWGKGPSIEAGVRTLWILQKRQRNSCESRT